VGKVGRVLFVLVEHFRCNLTRVIDTPWIPSDLFPMRKKVSEVENTTTYSGLGIRVTHETNDFILALPTTKARIFIVLEIHYRV